MSGDDACALEIRCDDTGAARIVPLPDADLQEGEVLVRIESFAMTANTITYAKLGRAARYWDAFPASAPGFARLPTWGYGTVVRSREPQIRAADRYYGFFPVASHVVVRPVAIRRTTFADGTPARAALNPLYGQYTLAPPATEREDALSLLFRPLFMTSFVLDDELAAQDYFGARTLLVSSASSRTAYGMAYLISRRKEAPRLVALTSAKNAAFVASLAVYGQIVPYEAVESLPAEASTYVDFSGNARLRERVKACQAAALRAELLIGLTHEGSGDAAWPSGDIEPFFAPSYVKRRVEAWGSERFAEVFAAAWDDFVRFLEQSEARPNIVYAAGPGAVLALYGRARAGRLEPSQSHIGSMFERAAGPSFSSVGEHL